LNSVKKRETKELIASLHWAIQQTAILIVGMLALVQSCLNFIAFLSMAGTATEDSIPDPDVMGTNLLHAVGCFAIVIAMAIWYAIRKKKYMEEHKNDSSSD